MASINVARVLVIATDGVEQAQLKTPRDRLREAGARVDVATPKGTEIRGWNLTDWGETIPADLKIADANIDDYDALVIPGGVMNPDKLRVDRDAMGVVQNFLDNGRLIATVCHGPWLLAQADTCAGVRMTSHRSIRKDIENAGAEWVDEQVVIDGSLITSRHDLDAFSDKIIEELQSRATTRPVAAE